jgi:hypothetical protein
VLLVLDVISARIADGVTVRQFDEFYRGQAICGNSPSIGLAADVRIISDYMARVVA